MRFKNLPYVHSGRNTHGVQADFNGSAVRQIGHIFLRNYAGDNALVSVAARHFVADLNLALGCDVNFYSLYDILLGTFAIFD